MAKLDAVIEVQETHYCILFFPVAKYERAGEAAVLKVFGISVWARIGDFRWNVFRCSYRKDAV